MINSAYLYCPKSFNVACKASVQPLRQLSIPKPWPQQKQQSEHPKIACMNGSSSASQTQYQQQPEASLSEAKKQASGWDVGA